MKGQISFWRIPPALKGSDLAWTLTPALLWWIAVHSRAFLITPHCVPGVPAQPVCRPDQLPILDRPAVGLEVAGADHLSFVMQGLSGVLALSVPFLWSAGLVLFRRIRPAAGCKGAATDLVLFAQTTFWNGLFTEIAHLLSQRGRPFVYADPARTGNFSNYTSFYSGHTSFSASAMTFIVLTLAGRGAPSWLLWLSGALAYALMSLTGTYRILAGRHFPTDVLFGALAGISVALWVAHRHRLRSCPTSMHRNRP